METICSNPDCKKLVEQKDKVKPKIYCSPACRQKIHRSKMKCIPIDEYEKLLAQIAENNKPKNKKRILAERNKINPIDEKHKQSQPISENDCFMPDPNYPVKKQGESGMDYKIRVTEYLENKK